MASAASLSRNWGFLNPADVQMTRKLGFVLSEMASEDMSFIPSEPAKLQLLGLVGRRNLHKFATK